MSKPDSLTCPRCGKTTHNPTDITEGYCDFCGDTTSGDTSLLALAEAIETGEIPEWRRRVIETKAVKDAVANALEHIRAPIGGTP